MLPLLLLCSLSGSLRYTHWRCWLSLPLQSKVSWIPGRETTVKKWKQSSQKDSQVLCEQPGNAKAKLYVTLCDMLASLYLLLWSFSTVAVMLNMSEHSCPTYLTFLLCSFYVLNCLASILVNQTYWLSASRHLMASILALMKGCFLHESKRWINLAYSILKNVILFNLHNKISTQNGFIKSWSVLYLTS